MSKAEEIKHLLEVSRQMRVDKTWPITEGEVIEFISSSSEFGFVCGALWQKQQDQETIELAEDHAMLAGMEKMKEQMTSKAIDAKVKADLDPHGADYEIQRLECEYGQLEALKIKNESKVKVIIIKEN